VIFNIEPIPLAVNIDLTEIILVFRVGNRQVGKYSEVVRERIKFPFSSV
jgi:hypothetical protein